jgi:hypothetical protein
LILGIAIDNCVNFETSISSPIQGIQCDLTSVFGHLHPYSKKLGNILYQMIYAYALQLQLLNGLWLLCFILNLCNNLNLLGALQHKTAITIVEECLQPQRFERYFLRGTLNQVY